METGVSKNGSKSGFSAERSTMWRKTILGTEGLALLIRAAREADANEVSLNEQGGILDFRRAIGAAKCLDQILQFYIADHDRNGKQIADCDQWIEKCRDLCMSLGEGCTTSSHTGSWQDPDTGMSVIETTHVIECYTTCKVLKRYMPKVRKLVHEYGHLTNQSSVAVVHNNKMYVVKKYDRVN